MPQVDINYLAVLIAAIASIALGAIWYSPAVFGKIWMKLAGISEEKSQELKKKGMGKSYFWMLVSTLVMAYVLALIIGAMGAATLALGLWVAFLAWLGFIATTTLGGILWEGQPVKLWILNNAFSLISLLVMGAILGVWV